MQTGEIITINNNNDNKNNDKRFSKSSKKLKKKKLKHIGIKLGIKKNLENVQTNRSNADDSKIR